MTKAGGLGISSYTAPFSDRPWETLLKSEVEKSLFSAPSPLRPALFLFSGRRVGELESWPPLLNNRDVFSFFCRGFHEVARAKGYQGNLDRVRTFCLFFGV